VKFRTRIILAITVFGVVIVLTVFFYFNTTVREKLICNASAYSNKEFLQTVDNIEMLVEMFSNAGNIICLNSNLSNQILNYEDKSPWERYKIYEELFHELQSVRNVLLFDYTLDVYIFIPGRSGPIYSNSAPCSVQFADIIQMDWFNGLSFIYSQGQWLTPAEHYLPSNIAAQSFIMLSPIWKSNALDYVGFLMIEVDERTSFRKLLREENTSNATKLYLFNEKNVLISSTDGTDYGLSMEELGFPVEIPDDERFWNILTYEDIEPMQLSYARIDLTDWVLLKCEPYKMLIAQADKMKGELIVLLVISMLLMVIVLALYSNRLVSPLQQIAVAAREISNGHFDLRIGLRRRDEIGYLSEAFDSMSQDISDLMQQLREESELRNRLYIEMLRNQLDPHMLFNSLTSIRSVANLNGNTTIAQMITHLAYLLESALGKNDEFIPLYEELTFCEHFVKFQQLRFNQFEYITQVDSAAMECMIPRMMIQPLIENSIRHGFHNNPIQASISLTVKKDGQWLCIELCDNGVGISAEAVAEIFNGRTERKIGLKNIYSRLRLYYADIAEQRSVSLMQINALPECGTCVLITIPEKPNKKYYRKGADDPHA
jgi:two-component system sensor histidine kinase YesM